MCDHSSVPRAPGTTGRKKVFRLADVIQPLNDVQVDKLTNMAVKRILQAEKAIACSGMAHVGLEDITAIRSPLKIV